MKCDLPIEIITSILSCLPVKSLSRFRCVSKPWCCLLKDPIFIKLHLDRGIRNNVPNVMLPFSGHLYSMEPNSDSLFHEAKEIDYPYKTSLFRVEILGSCRGLLYIRPDKDVYCIWNPSTQEFKKLPETPIEFYKAKTFGLCCTLWSVDHGFGHDDIANDYKVVRIFNFYSYDGVGFKTEVMVYTLGTDSWKRWLEDTSCHIVIDRVPGVLVNGGLHWAVMLKPSLNAIISFDLVDERFKVVPLPDYETDDGFTKTLGIFRGCLSVVTTFLSAQLQTQLQVWVMMEYGVKKSWIKLFSISQLFSPMSYYYLKPSFKLLSEMDTKNIVLYDFNSEVVQTFNIHGLSKWFKSETYVQSLVSLNTGTYVWKKQAAAKRKKRDKEDHVGGKVSQLREKGTSSRVKLKSPSVRLPLSATTK